MSAAILSLTGRSTEFDLVFSIRVTEEVSLCISLCKKVTVVISSVKAERVTPVSCVGVWCPLKQSQAYFHTKIIHVKIQLATYCSHSICINFKDEWQLLYLKRLALLHSHASEQFCTKLSFPYIFEELECSKPKKQIHFFAETSSVDPVTWCDQLN